MRKLLALAALALLASAPAFAQTISKSQTGDVGTVISCTDTSGATVKCVLPMATPVSVAGVEKGTASNPMVTSAASGTTGDINLKQVNGATVNVGAGAAGTGTQRVTTSTDSSNAAIGTNGSAAKTSSALMAVSDGTNQQQLIAPIALTDGVNGNNSVAVGNYVWNGTTWDRLRGSTSGIASAGVYNATPPTITDTLPSTLQLGSRGSLSTQVCGQNSATCAGADGSVSDGVSFTSALHVTGVGRLFNGTNYDRAYSTQGAISSAGVGIASVEEAGRSFSNITTNTTTTVKSGAGFLHTVCVNTKGATANTATIYNNTAGSGTKIGTLDTTASVGCQTYDAAFSTGLTIVTATGTAADLTVTYR